jgi:glycosyltransferase involved in cell wall biosynthesis
MESNKQLSLITFSNDWFREKDGRIWSSVGVSSSIRLFADNFKEVGIVAHLSPDPPDETKHVPYPQQYSLIPIPFRPNPFGRIMELFSVFFLAHKLVRKFDAPYLRMFSLEAFPAALYCTLFYRKPWFMSLHGDMAEAIDISWKSRNIPAIFRKLVCSFYKRITRFVCKKPCALYTAGPALKDLYVPDHPESEPFIDSGIRQEEVFGQCTDVCESQPYELIFVGNMKPRKGLDILLNVVIKLRKQNVPVKLTILGDGTNEDLERLCPDLDKIREYVEFGGFFTYGKPLFERMRQADILVVPSRGAEGWNRVITECAAQGVPAVVTDVNSLKASVMTWPDGPTGIVVPPEDPDAIVDAICQIIDNPDQRRAMVHRCVDRGQHYVFEKEFLRLRERLEKFYGDGLRPVSEIPLERAGR